MRLLLSAQGNTWELLTKLLEPWLFSRGAEVLLWSFLGLPVP